MKIIQIIPNLCVGGAEIMCETLTLELIKNNIEVVVVSLYSYETPITNRLIKQGVKIKFLSKKRGVDLSIIKKLTTIFKYEKPDVVHSHLNDLKYVMIAAKKADITRCIHTVHSVSEKELNKVDKVLAKIFYKKNKVIPVALSEQIQTSIVNVYGISRNLIPIIFNGIDLSRCIKKSDYTLGETIKILHIGRFSNEKNHIGLIDAFKKFHSVKKNSILELIGTGKKFDEIKKYVIDNGLRNEIVFLGLQTDVYKFIYDADIFILPSLYEGIPMTLIEAMGSAIPIIATNVGGIPDMLTNNENAILTSVDSEEIANELIRLSNDFELRERLGKNALIRANKFSAQKMACEYIKIYKGDNR